MDDLKRKEEKFVQKLNKSIKNKASLKTCENFCRNDYLVAMDKANKKYSKKYRTPYSPVQLDDRFSNNVCKKTYCNVKCAGYPAVYNKTTKVGVKNGFHKSYSFRKIKKLKQRGALSACNIASRDYTIFPFG
jgi:hypothetical protein